MKRKLLTPDLKELNSRTDHIFLIYYLALISIIEGVTFILLIERMFELFTPFVKNPCSHILTCPEFLSRLPYALTSLLIIVFTTYQYSVMLICFKWMLRVWDTFLPFLVGLLQAAQVYFLSAPFDWWLTSFLLALTGMITMLVNRKMFKDSLVVEMPQKVVNSIAKGIF